MTDPQTYKAQLHRLYREAMIQGGQFEKEAERWRLESELAYQDAGLMKAEGRRRSGVQPDRMLPNSQRGVDVYTNGFKDMQDAKGDFVLFGKMANTYANLAAMKYAKANVLMNEWSSVP